MKPRHVVPVIVTVTMTACNVTSPSSSPPSIDGEYDLLRVDGPGGGMFAAGSLALAAPAPEEMILTPAGPKLRNCVHEVPDGAHVDQAGVVTLPSGTQYQIPPCLTAGYTAMLTLSDQSSTAIQAESIASSGEYLWDGTTLVLKNSEGAEWLSGTAVAGMLSLSDANNTYTFSRAK